MLRAALLACALVAACGSSTVGTDLGLVEPGCRAPDDCYKTGVDCACARGDVATACLVVCATPETGCICPSGTRCVEAATVCVGRAATTCPGVGARCLPGPMASCATSGGEPPQLVGTGPGGALEPHCAFTDDVCCPGVEAMDLGVPDLADVD